MSIIQTQDPGTKRRWESHLRVWGILTSHEDSYVEELCQSNSWFQIKRWRCISMWQSSSFAMFWCEESGQRCLWWRGQRDASHSWVTTHFCAMTSTVATRRLRKTHTPDSVGSLWKAAASQFERSPGFYVSSARCFDSPLAWPQIQMGRSAMWGVSTLVPLELCDCLEPLLCRGCRDTLVSRYKFREGRYI